MKKWTLNLADIFFKHTYIFTALLTVAVLLISFGVHYAAVGHLFYGDTDSYMRLIRISDWLANFEWAERVFPYTNPPDGFELHFTRITDVIWVALSVPFMLFLPLKEALFCGGYMISPLFLVLVMWVLVWCYKTVLPTMQNQKMFFLLSVLYTLMLVLKLSDVFDLYRPDHHAVMCFLFVANVTVILCSYQTEKLWQFTAAGGLIGLGVWVSSGIEGFMIITALLSVLGAEWICGQRPIKCLMFYALGLFAVLASAWLINPPLGGLLVLDNNRLSLIHATAGAFIFLSFLFICWRNPQRIGAKIAYLGGSALVSVFLMVLLFGWKQFTIPVYQPAAEKYFLPYVTEMFPIWKFPFLIYGCVFCWAEMITLLILSKFRLPYLNSLAILLVFISVYSICVIRFYPYFLMLYVLINVLVFFVLMHLDLVAVPADNRYKIAVFGIFVLTMIYMFSFSARLNYVDFSKTALPSKQVCLTDIFYAPQLVYEKGIDTVGSPYHSNYAGIEKGERIWLSKDEKEIKQLLKKYNVRCILAEENGTEEIPEGTFKDMIVNGKNVYPWLIKREGYYEVKREN